MSPGRLEGKVAIITGASTGLGPVMASIFVREGAKVLLSARREELVLAAAAAGGEGAIGMRADVTNEDDVAAMVARASRSSARSTSCATTLRHREPTSWVWEQTLENWNATIAIDVTAAMLCTREVLRQSMLERRSGVILNFSSTAGFQGMVANPTTSRPRPRCGPSPRPLPSKSASTASAATASCPGGIDTELWEGWVRRRPMRGASTRDPPSQAPQRSRAA